MASAPPTAPAGGEPTPPTRILMRYREGLRAYLGPLTVTPEAGLPSPAVSVEEANALNGAAGGRSKARLAPVYSPSGDKVVVVRDEGQPLSLLCAVRGVELGQVACLDAQSVFWSPQGNYLVTWSRPTKGKEDGTIEGNLKVWDVRSNSATEPAASYSQKLYKRDGMLQWTQDEQLCGRLVTNEVHIHPGNHSGPLLGRVRHEGATQFRLSPCASPGTPAGSCTIGVFQAESSGNPARATLYTLSPGQALATAGISRTMFSASEATMQWNASGVSLLVHTHSDVDKTNTSYYGATGIFLLTTAANGELSEKISQTKEGPIHDVKWSPSGDRFILAAGSMPSQSTMYDSKGKVLYEFGAAHRNTVCWSPHGRFVMLAGFGNLAGEMDFYDMDPKKMKKIGSNTAHCSVSYGWSPDSRYFLTATLAPRMNVDNGFKIFKYNGAGPIVHVPVEQAYDVVWQPLPTPLFPNRGQSPRRLGEGEADAAGGAGAAAAAAAPPAPPVRAVYRPPGSTGVLAAMLSRDKAPVGKVKTNPDGSVAVASTVAPGARYPGDGAGAKPRVVPGMSPAQATAAAAEAEKAAKKKADKEKQKAREEEKKRAAAAAEAAAAAAAEAAKAKGPVPIDQLTPVEKDKRARALRKKLNLIGELKTKKDCDLNEDQRAKLATEEAVIAELAALGV